MSLATVIAAGLLLGAAQERLTVRPIRSAPHFVQITVTLGVAVAIRGAAFLIWGKDPLNVPGFSGDDVFFLWGAILPMQAIWIWGGTAILLVCCSSFSPSPRLAAPSARCSLNGRAARLMGINPQRMTVLVFAAGGAMSTLGGALIAPLMLASWDFRSDHWVERPDRGDFRRLPLTEPCGCRRPCDRRAGILHCRVWILRGEGRGPLSDPARGVAGHGRGVCARPRPAAHRHVDLSL